MHALRSALLVLLAAMLWSCSPTFNWRDSQLALSSAGTLLPCKPDRTLTRVPLGGLPLELAMAGCKTASATFAVMAAHLPPGTDPDPVLAGWQQATLANMRADPTQLERRDWRPRGGLPLPHAQQIRAQGHGPGGDAVMARAGWAAHAEAGGGTELLHLVIYAAEVQDPALDAFFEAARWP